MLSFLALLRADGRPPADARELLFGPLGPSRELVDRHPWYDHLPPIPRLLEPDTIELRSEVLRRRMAAKGLELVEAKQCDACCGFGGMFSIKHPELSVAIADRKLEELCTLGVDAVVSGDVSCLMQLGGRLERTSGVRPSDPSKNGDGIKTLHLAEVLAGK